MQGAAWQSLTRSFYLLAGVMNGLFSVYGKVSLAFNTFTHSIISDMYQLWIWFFGCMDSLYLPDIYDDLISRRVNSSDAEKFAEICPCPCNGVAWGVIWFVFI